MSPVYAPMGLPYPTSVASILIHCSTSKVMLVCTCYRQPSYHRHHHGVYAGRNIYACVHYIYERFSAFLFLNKHSHNIHKHRASNLSDGILWWWMFPAFYFGSWYACTINHTKAHCEDVPLPYATIYVFISSPHNPSPLNFHPLLHTSRATANAE